jgi:acetyltransferase EpsM
VVAEAILSCPNFFDLRGFVDPAPCEETIARLDIPRLGGDEAIGRQGDAMAVMGVGALPRSNRVEEIVERVDPLVKGWMTVVHARALVSPSAKLGTGCVVLAGAFVNTGARVGDHVVINSGAIVEHDVALGDFSYVAPRATLAGGVKVGRAAYIGLGAGVREYIKIGERSIVGMGAVVVKDVPAGSTVTGVPALAGQKR